MTDRLTPRQRSAHMARIRGEDTRPELVVRRALHAAGYRYRLHLRRMPARPDIVLPKFRAVVLVHGCFWHRHEGCRLAYMPKSRIDFWNEKFSGNLLRDHRQHKALLDSGWRVLVIWECALRGTARQLATMTIVKRWIRSRAAHAEFPPASTASLSLSLTAKFNGKSVSCSL